MCRFSKITQDVLTQAGWRPERRVDLGQLIDSMTKEGAPVNHPAEEFLRSFYGLTLTPPIAGVEAERRGHIYIKPERVHFAPYVSEGLSKLAGEHVCPLAYTGATAEIYMTDSGRIVFSDLEQTCFGILGRNYVEALEAMCDGRYLRVGGWIIDDAYERVGTFAPLAGP